MPHALVRTVARASGMVHVSSLVCAPGVVDPVMCSLGAAVLALFERPQRAGSLVQQHLALTICAHLVRRFGKNDGVTAAAPRRPLHLRHLH